MAPKAIPRRLSTVEVLEKFLGPKVDIYVGPQSIHHRVPKDVLCYYSTYFDRCFNGGFKEAQEQKLVLPEDSPEYFQLLMDYVFINGGEPVQAEGDAKTQMGYYMDFIEFAGKFDLAGATQLISGPLRDLLEAYFQASGFFRIFDPRHIEIVFRVLPEGHELRGLVTLLALKYGLATGHYVAQEKTVEGFAVETLHQLRKYKGKRGWSFVQKFCAGINHTV